MRLRSLRFFVPVFLAGSSLSVPTSAHAAPISVSVRDGVSGVGLYRLTMSAKDRKAKTVHLVVREGDTGLAGVMFDKEKEVELTDLRLEGTMLKGSIMTSEGLGELELNLRGDVVRGTLTVGGKLLIIEGDRDS